MSYFTDDWESNYAPDVGPQVDGTYGIPVNAQQYNSPANTAGYSSPMSQGTYNLLSQGITAATNLFALDKMVDYKKYEATNGGLFLQGYGAYNQRTTAVNPNVSMLLLMVAGVVLLMKD